MVIIWRRKKKKSNGAALSAPCLFYVMSVSLRAALCFFKIYEIDSDTEKSMLFLGVILIMLAEETSRRID